MSTRRSILDLNLEELEEVVKTNELPEGVDLSGLETRKDFRKLFRFRSNPASIASTLFKEKKVPETKDTSEIKEKSLQLRAQEIELKKLKLGSQTHHHKLVLTELKALKASIVHLTVTVTDLEKEVKEIRELLDQTKFLNSTSE